MERVNLSAGEWRVMEELWKAPATLMELVRALGESSGWAKSTVSTVVRRMEDKGLIRAEQEGRAKVFYPAIAREEAAVTETESLLSRVYHGSVGLMVSTLLQNRRISKEELKELQALLDQGEEEQT